MENSILEYLGVEIIGIISPVSICMLLVVLLVYSLSSPASNLTTPIRTAANLVYTEAPSDTTTQKLEGALLNAVVFVIIVAIVTFILVILYYYNFTNFLKNYMRFSAFFVLGSMGGSIFLSIIQHFGIPIDSITCLVLLFNFTIVGVLSVFSRGIPIVLRQVYMVLLGIIVAAWFTKLPEWTTWALLVALALYDLVAVLAPGGPLKILVELASSRDDELPALVYESRPVVSRNPEGRGSLGVLVGMASPRSIELQNVNGDAGLRNREDEEERSLLVADSHNRLSISSESSEHSTVVEFGSLGGRQSEIVEERSPLVTGHETEQPRRSSGHGVEQGRMDDGSSDENFADSMRPGIKLGLGDFVFYSVLVGRAAMYDLMTVYACYLAIISGLGCTLILLRRSYGRKFLQDAAPTFVVSFSRPSHLYALSFHLLCGFVFALHCVQRLSTKIVGLRKRDLRIEEDKITRKK